MGAATIVPELTAGLKQQPPIFQVRPVDLASCWLTYTLPPDRSLRN